MNDNTFEPYRVIFTMNADGSNKHALKYSIWEDSIPCFAFQKQLIMVDINTLIAVFLVYVV